jgi:hypothetical protein
MDLRTSVTGLLLLVVLVHGQGDPKIVRVAPVDNAKTSPPGGPIRTRVVVVHNNMVPVPIECFQPPDSGSCAKDMVRVFYDHETRTCKPFSYTGCGGNANRFLSVKNCYRICHPFRYQAKPQAQPAPPPPVKEPLPPQTQTQQRSMALYPVRSVQTYPVVQNVPVVREGYIGVPVNK